MFHQTDHSLLCVQQHGMQYNPTSTTPTQPHHHREATDLLIQHLELYRDTRYSIWGQGPFEQDAAKRERALRKEMQTDGNLHPALAQPSGQYRVLHAVSEALALMFMRAPETHAPIARVFVRELLASSVLRPVMMLITPYTINKVGGVLFDFCIPCYVLCVCMSVCLGTPLHGAL